MFKFISILITLLILSGCSTLFAPPSGTHYDVEYGEIKVSVDDWTDREGVEFEYTTKEGTKVVLKKASVDTTTPATAIAVKSNENVAAALEIVKEVVLKKGL